MPIPPLAPPATDRPLPLLGGLTPERFMRRHWQKKPLLIRQAMPGFEPPLARNDLFALAAREGVESRLIERGDTGWTLRQGPFERRALPALKRPGWTLLVQGVDLHVQAAHELLQRFRFVPDARLDDLMISWASEGGGVGPHFDSYDVFLLQASGRRRWRIGRQDDLSLQPGVPLKILQNFTPEESFVLEPGDMLYLPPRWAHDGDALDGDCMTCSIGFRAPQRGGLAGELLQRMADAMEDETLYRDPRQAATARQTASSRSNSPDVSGRIPPSGARRSASGRTSFARAVTLPSTRSPVMTIFASGSCASALNTSAMQEKVMPANSVRQVVGSLRGGARSIDMLAMQAKPHRYSAAATQ